VEPFYHWLCLSIRTELETLFCETLEMNLITGGSMYQFVYLYLAKLLVCRLYYIDAVEYLSSTVAK